MKHKQIVGSMGVIKKNGKILMGLRHEPTIPDLHNRWEFPGGEVEFDEHPEETVVREVKEEVGVKVRVKKLIPYVLMRYFDYDEPTAKLYFYAYECKIIGGKPHPANIEVKKVKWFYPKEINPETCTPFTKELVTNYLRS